MAGFSENTFIKKLEELNNSSQSIQTLSLWLIHHRKHHQEIVEIWFRELLKAKASRKLTFMYLANDVIQNSKKKGPEFGKEFGTILKKVFADLGSKNLDEKTKSSLERLLNIWSERGVYDNSQIIEFKAALLLPSDMPPQAKRKRHLENTRKEKRSNNFHEHEVTVEVNGMVETHVQLSPHTPAGDPPEPEELIKAIQELESNTASADEAVRQRIAQLPREVSEISLLSKIENKSAAENLSNQVDEAVHLLNDYNSRLSAEIECRKKVADMLRDFLQAQRELLAHAESCLEEYQEKLQKAYTIRQDLKAHMQNLPDLTQLPDVTGGLAPLPSAGDLFSIH